MSEDRIWRVAQSVGFDDYELRPMLEAFAAALSKPAPSPQPAAPVVSAEQIEDLAWLDVDEDGEIDRSSDHNKMMTAPQRCAFKRGARAILDLCSADHPDTLRCIKARNDLNAVLHGEGAIIDDLEHAIANACAKLLRPAVEPMTPEGVDAKCLTIIGHLLSRRERDRIVWRMAEAHHGIAAKAEGGA